MQLGESDSYLEGALYVVVTGCRLLQSPFCTAVNMRGGVDVLCGYLIVIISCLLTLLFGQA